MQLEQCFMPFHANASLPIALPVHTIYYFKRIRVVTTTPMIEFCRKSPGA